jgi:hypothetical protein
MKGGHTSLIGLRIFLQFIRKVVEFLLRLDPILQTSFLEFWVIFFEQLIFGGGDVVNKSWATDAATNTTGERNMRISFSDRKRWRRGRLLEIEREGESVHSSHFAIHGPIRRPRRHICGVNLQRGHRLAYRSCKGEERSRSWELWAVRTCCRQ